MKKCDINHHKLRYLWFGHRSVVSSRVENFTGSKVCQRVPQHTVCVCSVLSGMPACEHTDKEQVLLWCPKIKSVRTV